MWENVSIIESVRERKGKVLTIISREKLIVFYYLTLGNHRHRDRQVCYGGSSATCCPGMSTLQVFSLLNHFPVSR